MCGVVRGLERLPQRSAPTHGAVDVRVSINGEQVARLGVVDVVSEWCADYAAGDDVGRVVGECELVPARAGFDESGVGVEQVAPGGVGMRIHT